MIKRLKFLVRQFPFIYPSRVIASCRQWISDQRKKTGSYQADRGPWFKDILPADFLHHPQPKTVGPVNNKAFAVNSDYPTQTATLYYLQNSYVLGHKGLILNKTHQVFQEFSHHFGVSSLSKFLLKHPFYIFSKDATRVEGVGAVLISPESQNYYHWLNDVLPRIRLYRDVLDKIDYFCVSSKVPAKFLDILVDFNIPREKLFFVAEKQKVWFDHLYVASLPGSEGRSPLWAVDYLRQILAKDARTLAADKKIYLKRGQNIERRILNEVEVEDLLRDHGFDIIDPDGLSVKQQIQLMQQAKIVVGFHGAALSNLLFINSGTKVIEIFSPDYFRTDCYYTLSAMLKLDYWYLLATKPAGADWGDVVVDINTLKNTITA